MMGMGFGLTGLLFMFLFWGGLVALAIWLVSAHTPNDVSQLLREWRFRAPSQMLDDLIHALNVVQKVEQNMFFSLRIHFRLKLSALLKL